LLVQKEAVHRGFVSAAGEQARADFGEVFAHLQRRRKPGGDANSAAHHNRQLRGIKRFARFLHERGKLLVDPFADLPPLRTPRRLPRGILSAAQVIRLLQQPNLLHPIGFRDRAMLELVYSCGLRGLELCKLTIYNLVKSDR
jgi:integrase/recombinase XerD